jgi:hypothetical protein
MAVRRFSASRSPTQLLINGVIGMWEFGPMQVKKPVTDERTYRDLALSQESTQGDPLKQRIAIVIPIAIRFDSQLRSVSHRRLYLKSS